MNNTKWNEIFKAFYKNECEKNNIMIYWRTKDIETGYISNWNATWTHFGSEPREWDKIDYLQIQLTDSNKKVVIENLKAIHVPSVINKDIWL